MVRLLNSEDIVEHWQTLKNLLVYCREFGSAVTFPDSYYEEKLNGLVNYLNEGKAYFFVVQDGDIIVGFLWACVIEREVGRVFHILYLAVLESYQGKGYGKILLESAQLQARKLNLSYMELNVNASNQKAIGFYRNNAFYDDHITMRKQLV